MEHVFTLSYDSPKKANHTISAELLGKNLTSMTALIKESNKLLNGEDSTINVHVKAHKEGSFEVEFVTWLSNGGIDVLKTIGLTGVAATTGAANFMAALKTIRTRRITAKAKGSNGKWLLTFNDGDTLECDENINKLIDNHSIRKKFEEVITDPIKDDPETKIKFISQADDTEEKNITVIDSSESAFFVAPAKKTLSEITVETQTVNIRFTVISLEKVTGWSIRLPNDDDDVKVKITDDAFIERINNRENSFSKGDMFEVELETTFKRVDGKTSISRSITKVIRHRTDKSKKIIEDVSGN